MTVKGNGFGLGRWSREGDTVLFVPREERASWILEPHDLAITFEEAQAVVAGEVLELTLADGATYPLKRTQALQALFSTRDR